MDEDGWLEAAYEERYEIEDLDCDHDDWSGYYDEIEED